MLPLSSSRIVATASLPFGAPAGLLFPL